MAATMQVTGIEELSAKLNALGDKAQEIAARSLYPGAGIMADAYAAAVNSIVTSEVHPMGDRTLKRYATAKEKAALQGKIGIAKYDMNGAEVGTAVGVSGGYVDINGKPKAIRMLANAINSGTSFMNKQPVWRKAKSQGAGPASAAIVEAADKLIEEITK